MKTKRRETKDFRILPLKDIVSANRFELEINQDIFKLPKKINLNGKMLSEGGPGATPVPPPSDPRELS